MPILPQDYVVGQQIGVLAYAVMQLHLTDSASRARGTNLVVKNVNRAGTEDAERRAPEKLRDRWVRQIIDKLSALEGRGIGAHVIPVSTLHLLAHDWFRNKLTTEDAEAFSFWHTVYRQVVTGWLDSPDGSRPSQANAASLIAHQILYSDVRPKAIVDCAASLLSAEIGRLANDWDILPAIQRNVQVLRDATRPTSLHIEAVNNIAASLATDAGASRLIRNALFDHVLGWPLLTVGSLGERPIGAISLPVAVDIWIGEPAPRGPTAFRTTNIAVVPEYLLGDGALEEGPISLDEWRESLAQATWVGANLWRAKNGSRGSLRSKVLGATAVFDFRYVQQITEGIGFHPWLRDRSVETYFSQMVLAKAIGRHCGMAAAITGAIGEQRQETLHPSGANNFSDEALREISGGTALLDDEDFSEPIAKEEDYILDWHLDDRVEAISQKKSFVYNSFKYNRLALPAGLGGGRGLANWYVETNECRFLSDVADCVQVGGWRQFKYIRCPDVAHALGRYSHELPSTDSQSVRDVLVELATAKKPILQLGSDVMPSALIQALRHLNFEQRVSDARPAPSLSWTIIRTIEDELDSRFWHLIWRALHAPRHLYNELKLSSTPEQAARIIARALNTRGAHETTRSRRAPDLLILLGCHRLRSETPRYLRRRTRPLAFESVMEALENENIHPVWNERMRQFIGSTRIIALERDDQVGQIAPKLHDLPRQAREVLGRLSMFRFGFTQQLASVLLHNMIESPSEARAILKDLCDRGLLTYGGGWYCVRQLNPENQAFVAKRSNLALATEHLFAGLGFAPYLLKWSVPGLNVAEALAPEFVREAIYHLEEAATYANDERNQTENEEVLNIRAQARLAQQRIMRLFDEPSWGLIGKLSKRRANMPTQEVYDLAKEFLQLWRDDRPASSYALVTTARATERFYNSVKQGKASGDANRLFDEVLEYFDEAIRAIDLEADDVKLDIKMDVYAAYALFLRQHAKSSPEHMRRCTVLEDGLVSMLRAGVRGDTPDAAWFERYGDQLKDDAAAAEIYQYGLERVPGFLGNWCKGAGASIRAGVPISKLREQFRLLETRSRKTVDDAVSFEEERFKRHYVKGRHVIERWRKGMQFFTT